MSFFRLNVSPTNNNTLILYNEKIETPKFILIFE
jgi:hypothetical protein